MLNMNACLVKFIKSDTPCSLTEPSFRQKVWETFLKKKKEYSGQGTILHLLVRLQFWRD